MWGIDKMIQRLSDRIICKSASIEASPGGRPMLDVEMEYYGPVEEFPQSVPKVKVIHQFFDLTTVYWEDGTSTTVRRTFGEPDSPYVAFLAALGKKVYGSNSAIKSIVRRKTRP